MTDLPNVTYSESSHQLRLDEKIIPTATSVSGMLDKPGLPFGASKEAALFAVYSKADWIDLPDVEAYHKIRKHHAGVWGEKAARGTTVHEMAMRWAQGFAVDVPAECMPYMDALERFYKEIDPVWIMFERSVLSLEPGLEYGGRFDYIRQAEDGAKVLGDWKTGKRYPIESTVQLSGYRYAEHVATFEGKQLAKLEPMPHLDRCEITYLHGDGTFEVLPVPADLDAFRVFLNLRAAWSWLREMERWQKANPEPARSVVSA